MSFRIYRMDPGPFIQSFELASAEGGSLSLATA
jgi:hypothetical protein